MNLWTASDKGVTFFVLNPLILLGPDIERVTIRPGSVTYSILDTSDIATILTRSGLRR